MLVKPAFVQSKLIFLFFVLFLRMTAYGLTENKDLLEGIQPTGRCGSPEDIGGLAVFLASRAGAHMTGNALALDGGQNLQFMSKI